MKLNLGAADRRIENFISVDIAGPADQIVDLAGPWPWPDSSVEEVMALDVCEHIRDAHDIHFHANVNMQEAYDALKDVFSKRHPLGRIHFMNELHRVLQSGARATIETPNAAKGVGYFQDPTHVSPYCLSTFKYFEHGAFARERLGDAYGITARFRVLSLEESLSSGEDPREQVLKIKAVLEAVKP